MRAIVLGLSLALHGRDLALPEFPVRRDVRGYGMSDWDGYASRLRDVLDYTNTFYHQAPRLDITDIDVKEQGTLDFLITSDVYEHIAPPVQRAFENARRLLKPHGFMVFSVPYAPDRPTHEHFPDLWDFHIDGNSNGERVLHNTTRDGRQQEFSNLIFHGGPGSTLEMRQFGFADLMQNLREAGFETSVLLDQPAFARGIFWGGSSSFPLVAFADACDACGMREALSAGQAVHWSEWLADVHWGPQRFEPKRAPGHLWVRARHLGLLSVRIALDDRLLPTEVSGDGSLMSAAIPADAIHAGAPLEVSLNDGEHSHRLGHMRRGPNGSLLRYALDLRTLARQLRRHAHKG